MLRQRTQNANRKVSGRNGLTQFPFIVQAAKELQVNRTHLWYVLIGDRHSPRCLAGYKKIRSRLEQESKHTS